MAEFELELTRGVAHIRLNRPERLNALTFDVYRQLADTFDSLSENGDVRAICLSGEGRGFCSGGDVEGIIRELFNKDMTGLLEFTRWTGNLIRSIYEASQPVIAAVNGVAVGAGAVIAAACDLRVVSETARFGYIFPRVGLSGADMGASWLLPRIVGRGNAAELLLLGDLVDAQTAYRMGLANRLVADGPTSIQLAGEWAAKLASGPAFAHKMTKRMLDQEQGMTLRDALEAEAQAQAICMAHPDFRIAFEANQKKERPQFTGAPPSDP